MLDRINCQNNPVNFYDPDGLFPFALGGPLAASSGLGVGAVDYSDSQGNQGLADAFWATSTLNPQVQLDALRWLADSISDNSSNSENDNSEDSCPNDEEFADDIADHAKKHNPRIPTDELSELIKDTLKRGDKKDLERGRRAYQDPLTGRVVIVDPSSPHKGTSFIPGSRGYFDGLQ